MQTKDTIPSGHVIPFDIALQEIKAFAEYHKDEELTDEKVKEDYPDLIKAKQLGVLDTTDAKRPVLQLREPIKTESGAIDTSTINFRTRLKPSDQERLAKGIDFAKDGVKYTNICRAYFAQLASPLLLDSLSKFDLKVIDQASALFM